MYGDGNVYRGQRSKDSETKTMTDKEAEIEMLKRLLFQAQTAAMGLSRQLEIYEAALESITMMQPDSLEKTKAMQALAQVRGVLL